MIHRFCRSRVFRSVSWTLVLALVFTSVPAQAWDQSEPGPAEPPPPPKVKVNRTPPKVKPVPLYPVFSESPTVQEIFRARVFGEALVPLGTPSFEENRALAEALTTFLTRSRKDGLEEIETFLSTYPGTPWRASLLLNTGVLWRRWAFFTRAEKALTEAWYLAQGATDAHGRATADRALSELLELHMAFGRMELLEQLLKEVEDREILGGPAERVADAKATVYVLRERHHEAIPSGPVALQRVLSQLQPGLPPNQTLASFHADPDGATLPEMLALSRKAGMTMQMAFRPAGLDVSPEGKPLPLQIPAPSMIHLRAGHFGAVVEVRTDRVRLDDPLLGGEVWMSRDALAEEATGYFLVPEGTLPAGWRRATATETRDVRGKCAAVTPDDDETKPDSEKDGGDDGKEGGEEGEEEGDGEGGEDGEGESPGSPPGGCGMAVYSFHALLVSLNIRDNPIGYSPPVGPSVRFRVTYNQREAQQPAIFYYSNLGTRWTFNWLSYVEDDPADPFQQVHVYRRGGGRETYTGSDGTTYAPNVSSRAVVVRTSASPVRYERRLANGWVEVFAQPDGAMTSPRRVFLTERRDPAGNALVFTYDSDLRLTSVTDAIGQVTTLSYDLSQDPLKVTRVTDPFGRSATLSYDGSGRLVRITDVIGITSEFQYGSGDFIRALTTPYGTTTFTGATGAAADRWLEARDPLGGVERIEYRTFTPEIPASDPAEVVPVGFAGHNSGLGHYNTFYWNKRALALFPGDVTQAKRTRWLQARALLVSSRPQSRKRALENRVWYFQEGELINKGVGSAGRATTVARVLEDGTTQAHRYEWNRLGGLTRHTDPLGRETVLEYDANETDLLRVKQKNGSGYDLVTSSTYGLQHRPLSRTSAAGQTWTYTYNARGQLVTVTTPARAGIAENRTTTFAYDADGRLLSVAGPGPGSTTSVTHDGYGRVRTVSDEDGYTVTLDYDGFDRPTRTTYPDATYSEVVYERLDPERFRDRLGRWSIVVYDALRRMVASRDAAGRTTRFEYCLCGGIDRLIDPNGNPTSWERDAQNRVVREVRANGAATVVTYETATSRVKQIQDPKGQIKSFQYLRDGRLQQLSYANAEHPTPSVVYTYDPAYPRVVTRADGVGTTTYTYHPVASPPQLGAGQLASVDAPEADDTVTYAYDELGRLVTRGIGATTGYGYDVLGRIQTVMTAIGSFGFAYDGATGRVLTATYPNGQTSAYAYYANAGDRRLQEIHHRVASGGATLSRFTYAYNTVGNITTWTQQFEANPGRAYDFSYDAADQLVGATFRTLDPTPTVLKRYGYVYDPLGNRTGEQVDDAPVAGSFDNMNRLLSRQPGGPLLFRGTTSEPASVTVQGGPARTTSAHRFEGHGPVPPGTSTAAVSATDASGNVRTSTYQVSASGDTTTYTYDANGNLSSKAEGATTWTHEWDAENRLLRALSNGAEVARFVYDGGGRRVRKIAGGVTRTYVYDAEDIVEERASPGGTTVHFHGPGIDQPLASRDGGGAVSYYLTDHLGSVMQTTTAAASVSLTRQFDPFGVPLSGADVGGYAFTGREWDSETGLYYYRARYYDPRVGRFTQSDPLGFAARELNLYLYVGNAPGLLTDPYGLAPWYLRMAPHMQRGVRVTPPRGALPRLPRWVESARPSQQARWAERVAQSLREAMERGRPIADAWQEAMEIVGPPKDPFSFGLLKSLCNAIEKERRATEPYRCKNVKWVAGALGPVEECWDTI